MATAGCGPPAVAELYPQLNEHVGREIEEVEFVNTAPFSPDSLASITETRESDCTLIPVIFPFCFPGTDWGRTRRYVDLGTIGQDLAVLNLLYRQHGYFGTTVVPEVEDLPDEDDAVLVRFRVQRGDGVILDSLVVQGTEGVADPDSLEAELPLQPDGLFNLADFLASADTVTSVLRRRGHAYSEVLRNYAVDTLQDRATAWLIAIPGPRVAVDSIVVLGTDKLNRHTTLRYVPFEQGDLLRRSDLARAQRNLYELELVQFANVQIAPDSAQLTPDDSTTATVEVQVAEAPEHVVEAAVGWGSVECFRTSAQWTDRSLFRGARRLTLTGSVSRIGIGGATDVVGHDLCTAGRDTFATRLDYRVSGELTQPYFLTAANRLVLGAFAERQSEPRLYQRTAQGSRFTLTHRIAPREALTAAVDVERREVEAVPALYCYAFAVCQPEDIAALARTSWRNALGAAWLRDRSNSVLDPTEGYTVQASGQWATSLLGSTYDFVRANTEGTYYRPLRQDWTMAFRVRAGSFLTAAT
ncbi:MAG TPA: BamA/TamA family outer membrane protein, partial [Longimicrobiales bacterium]|nr:BamA/TamA family outer membrane protein [Longimicrobiales bacterium]